MELSLKKQEFQEYVSNQLNHFFPDNKNVSFKQDDLSFNLALERTEYCFKDVILNSYKKNGHTFLNHLHSDQYTVFLWFLSNSVWKETVNDELANKLFYLNKALNGFSCMYDTNLPDIFLILHSVGTVLGKAEYGDYLVVAQGSTVGAHNGIYPTIGKGVGLLPNSSIIGDSKIGDKVSIGINTTVYGMNIDSENVVFTDIYGEIQLKRKEKSWALKMYSDEI